MKRWEWAETHLRDYLGHAPQVEAVVAVAQRVEDGWAESMERYVLTLTARMRETETADKIGILKGIDTVSLHLAQREVFALSQIASPSPWKTPTPSSCASACWPCS